MERLDITRDHCPMTMVKVKLKLARIAKGERLEVLMSGGDPVDNVPRTVQEQGSIVLEVTPVGENYRVTIEK